MQRRGYFSGLGCLSVLILLLLVGLMMWLQGGPLLASPGPLSAAILQATPLQGFQSHADFENDCGRCHAPVWSSDRMADRCLACHANVAESLAANDGLHGRLREPRKCKTCHVEHQGRQAHLTRLDVAGFPHQVETVGFTLARHQKDFDDTPLECSQCHTNSLSTLDQATCIECHAEGQRAFTDQHRVDFGDDCLSCHDGSGNLTNFDHGQLTNFSLAGKHREVKCQDCHVQNQFKADQRFAGTPTDCAACHAEPRVHRGLLGTQCADCHTANAWSPALLPEHTFPLNHRSRTNIACDVCHDQGTFQTYTCYNCHEHNPAKAERKHQKEGIPDFQDCMRCHPTGREHEGEGRGREGGGDD